jgi:hypothetical protein
MVAYEFYERDEKREAHLLGILPERRKKPERITAESVRRWGRQLKGGGATTAVYFVEIEV